MKLPTDMVERAARGICTARSFDPDSWFRYTTGKLVRDKDGTKVRLWTVYEADASAALEAALSDCQREWVSSTINGMRGIVVTDADMIGKRVALVPLDEL